MLPCGFKYRSLATISQKRVVNNILKLATPRHVYKTWLICKQIEINYCMPKLPCRRMSEKHAPSPGAIFYKCLVLLNQIFLLVIATTLTFPHILWPMFVLHLITFEFEGLLSLNTTWLVSNCSTRSTERWIKWGLSTSSLAITMTKTTCLSVFLSAAWYNTKRNKCSRL